MKLEYLPDGSPDCPLIRLFEFTSDEAEMFHTQLVSLASGTADRIAVHELPFIDAIGGCRLTLRTNPWDAAMIHLDSEASFDCALTRETWDNVAGLAEPLAQGGTGYQWLAEVPGEATWLLSVDGFW